MVRSTADTLLYRRVIQLVAIAALVTGCSGDSTSPDEPTIARVASVSVSIPRSAFRVGESLQAAALPLDSVGGVLTGRDISWSSSNPEVATVSAGGLVTGIAPGVAAISADVDGKSGTVVVQLSLVPVSTVTVTPASEAVSAGASIRLSAILKDSAGRQLTGRPIAWISSAPAVATVSDEGLVAGLLVGSTQITATAEGKQGNAAISVNTLSTPVASITLDPATANMSGGATKQLSITLRDANGNVLGGRDITWTSGNPSRATVSNAGLVTALLSDGPVTITATVEGKTATVSIGVITFVRLSAGSGFTCGLTGDGTPYCWGANGLGQVGDGTTINRLTPTKVATDLKFAAIASGNDDTCGIVDAGFAYCWGGNASGKLGTGSTASNSLVPAPVGGNLRFVSIAPAASNTCATTNDRELYCWGQSIRIIQYECGGGCFDERREVRQELSPVKFGDGIVAAVASVGSRYCGVDSVGLAYCWTFGYNTGLGGKTAVPDLLKVSNSFNFTTLRVGLTHTCGIIATGQAYCWGTNDYGQLGDGSTVTKSAPVAVAGGLLFQSLAAGGTTKINDDTHSLLSAGFTCGLSLAGKAYCWGANRFGELGTGSSVQTATVPQEVSEGAVFTGLRGGANHVCGLAVGGPAYCWGANFNGAFGDQSTISSTTPTLVFGK
jgi:alpha-tubulin suppressor-like RCC1 family protein/uncharacterized protein YjdB